MKILFHYQIETVPPISLKVKQIHNFYGKINTMRDQRTILYNRVTIS